jgi:OsmC subfamily peroxiredoxin
LAIHEQPKHDDGAASPKVLATLHGFAERMRQLRTERGFRLADLAAISGLSEGHLYRLEQGERWPSVPALLTLAGAYGVEPSVLLSGPTPPNRVTRHQAEASWTGGEATGSGVMVNHDVKVCYDRESRLTPVPERGDGGDGLVGSPEELIGMAFAGCFSMSLAQRLGDAGFEPQRIDTSAEVRLGVSPEQVGITEIVLTCDADVREIDDARFQEIAHVTKRTCVVSRALLAVPVTLDARLKRRRRRSGNSDSPQG